MYSTLKQFGERLDSGVDDVKRLSADFCQIFNLTMFGYVRIYHDGRIGWVTSNADQDRFLIESGAIKDDPYVDTAKGLQRGGYIWNNHRQFHGSDAFYQDRARLFQVDHGLILVKHQEDYLETACFSGSLAKKQLYNVFLQEMALFDAFMDHFKASLSRPLLRLIVEGLHLSDLKQSYSKPYESLSQKERDRLLTLCGFEKLIRLSTRERECLRALGSGLSYQQIGRTLKLSARTVEHYLESVKNKLDLQSRSELLHLAVKFVQIGG